jgi:phosphatidylinositol dimannoside acyltransferase
MTAGAHPSGTGTSGAGTSGTGPSGTGPSIRGRVLVGLLGLLARLPEAPLVAAADAVGELWYRLAPRRRAQVRANLARVCESLAETGRGTPFARRAGTDPDALERMTRAVFRHATRYYLEVARVAAYDHEAAIARIDVETPGEVRDALESGQPIMLVGMHYGAIELPAVEVAHRLGHPVTAPMEAVDDPALRHWFESSRGRVGVRIVPIANARRELLRALRSGRSVGMVADRDLTRGGIEVPLFGHPAPIPAGPALVALEAGVPVYVGSARRVGGGRYRGRLIHVPTPETGTHRERVVALTASIASAFESILADAPEQWWGSFHPIWPDLVPAGRGARPAAAGTSASAGTGTTAGTGTAT